MVDNDTWLRSAEVGKEIMDHIHARRNAKLTEELKARAEILKTEKLDARDQKIMADKLNKILFKLDSEIKEDTVNYFKLRKSHEKILIALERVGNKYDALVSDYNALVKENDNLKARLESSNKNLYESRMKVGILDQEIQSVLRTDKHGEGFENGLERLREANDAFDDEVKKDENGKFYIEE